MKRAEVIIGLVMAWGMVGSLGAQVPPPPLRNVRVQASVTWDAQTGVYTYHYTITNPPENVLAIEQFVMAIDVPPDRVVVGTWDDPPPHDDSYHNPGKPVTIVLSDGQVYQGKRETTPVAIAENAYKVKVLPYGGFSPKDPGAPYYPCGLTFSQTPTTVSLLNAPVQAGWGCGIRIQPGETRSGYRMTSYGLPGIREMEIQPSFVDLLEAHLLPGDWFPEETDPDFSEKLTQAHRKMHELGMKVMTVGPVGPPRAFHPLEYLQEIRQYIQRSVELGWLLDPDLATDLQGRIDDIEQGLRTEVCPGEGLRQKFQAFLDRVEGASEAQRTSEARGLLYFNMKVVMDAVAFCIPLTFDLRPGRSVLGLNETVTLRVRMVRGTEPEVGTWVSA